MFVSLRFLSIPNRPDKNGFVFHNFDALFAQNHRQLPAVK
jgi:hypothetical protein